MRFEFIAMGALLVLFFAGCQAPDGRSESPSKRLADIEASEKVFREMLKENCRCGLGCA